VEQENIRRVVFGLNPKEVEEHILSLTKDRDDALTRALEAEDAYTKLRLASAKQVEEASAEAAVVLGHARSEAARIRESAAQDADKMRRDGEALAQKLVDDAESNIASRMDDLSKHEEEADKNVRASQDRADEILRFANSQAENLRSEAYEVLRSAEARSQAADNEMRLKRLDAERAEADLIEQADQYSRRVHQEADRHWQTTQRRSEELRQQAEDLLRESQQRANDTSKESVDRSRRLMEETMDQLTRIGSEVGGSMAVISRVRRQLGDQLDRLELAESRLQPSGVASLDDVHVSLAPASKDPALDSGEDTPTDVEEDDDDQRLTGGTLLQS
jgi:hypothetical protein